MDIVPKDIVRHPEYNIIALMRTSVIVASVMLLKAHLKTLYSLSEEYAFFFLFTPSIDLDSNCSKCNKFVIGKKSAVGDKPAIKRHDKPISWDRLPFATNPLHTTHDAEVQKAKVRACCCISLVIP
jgi:cohesin loading factor subunit SCC2